MRANKDFLGQDKIFWAHVRTISGLVGYTNRKAVKPNISADNESAQVKVPTYDEIKQAFEKIGLDSTHIQQNGLLTHFGKTLLDYFEYRATTLNSFVSSHLMTAIQARGIFEELKATHNAAFIAPKNKQSGDKKNDAYFTGIINLLIDANAQGLPWNHDPQKLTTFVRSKIPLRTFARRLDGAFTSTVNPIAIWEIKEYYYTTTFGSRIADGIYETLLDGMEIEEVREHEKVDVLHYLMVDAHNTWWSPAGRPYLCRMIDMLHMRYVDEILFGYEVVKRLPTIVAEWVEVARSRPDLFQYNDTFTKVKKVKEDVNLLEQGSLFTDTL